MTPIGSKKDEGPFCQGDHSVEANGVIVYAFSILFVVRVFEKIRNQVLMKFF